MSRIRSRDTKPEVLVRSALHRLGFRFRLHCRDLPGCPDIVLRKYKSVIFVHGCFWHRHPDPNCRLARFPKSHLDFWIPKLEENRSRDERIWSKLNDLGWGILIIWECQVHDVNFVKDIVGRFLDNMN